MGKVVYLDQLSDRSSAENSANGRTGARSEIVGNQPDAGQPERDLVAENLTLLAEERKRLNSTMVGSNRPPSYKTTRVYELHTVIADFALADSPIVRLAKGVAPDSLPVIAVVHGSQMGDDERPALLIGQTIFVNHSQFENWVAGNAVPSFEERLLMLLTQYLSIGNVSPV